MRTIVGVMTTMVLLMAAFMVLVMVREFVGDGEAGGGKAPPHPSPRTQYSIARRRPTPSSDKSSIAAGGGGEEEEEEEEDEEEDEEVLGRLSGTMTSTRPAAALPAQP